MPAIWSSAVLVFVFSFTSFGVVLVLGGPQFATLEVNIYELTVKLFQLDVAGALALVQMVFTYAFLLVYTRLQAQGAVAVTFVSQDIVLRRKRGVRDVIVVVGIISALLIVLSPLWALVVRALSTGDGYSLAHYAALFSDDSDSFFYRSPLQAIGNSIRFAFASMAIALVVGTASAYVIA
jgi:thiamine transport system permease protein